MQQELAAVTPARRVTTRAAVAAAAILLVAAAAAYFYLRRTPALTDTDTIVLGDFTNTTGDPVFDGTLRQGLAAQLQQSPFLSLVTDDRIGKTLALMQQPPDARLTPEIAQGVCVRTASAVVLDGSIASLGSQTSSACARGTAPPATSSPMSRRRRPARRMSSARSVTWSPRSASDWASRASPSRNTPDRSRKRRRRLWTRGRRSPPPGGCTSHPAARRPNRCSSVPSRSTRTSRAPMHSSGTFTAPKESRRYRGRARSRHTSCAIARATSSGSTSRRCTTGRSPATWTGRWRRWKRGRKTSARSHTSRIAGRLRDAEHRQIRAVDRRSREVNGG